MDAVDIIIGGILAVLLVSAGVCALLLALYFWDLWTEDDDDEE